MHGSKTDAYMSGYFYIIKSIIDSVIVLTIARKFGGKELLSSVFTEQCSRGDNSSTASLW